MDRPLLAIDVDGVVADLHPAWLSLYNRDYDDDLRAEDVSDWALDDFVKPECGERIYEYLSHPQLYSQVKPIDGALDAISLLRTRGYPFVFVTSCYSPEMARQKWIWLLRQGFISNGSDGTNGRNRLIITEDKSFLDIPLLVDDAVHNFKDWKGRGVLFDQPWNQKATADWHSARWRWVKRCRGWKETIDHLCETGDRL